MRLRKLCSWNIQERTRKLANYCLLYNGQCVGSHHKWVLLMNCQRENRLVDLPFAQPIVVGIEDAWRCLECIEGLLIWSGVVRWFGQECLKTIGLGSKCNDICLLLNIFHSCCFLPKFILYVVSIFWLGILYKISEIKVLVFIPGSLFLHHLAAKLIVRSCL